MVFLDQRIRSLSQYLFFRWIAAIVLAVIVICGVIQIPIDAPDTSSPPAGNSTASVNDSRTVGQTFVPERDGLDRISVVLGVEQPSDQAEITFHIKESPSGESLRTVRRSLMDLPQGDAANMRPGTITQQWYTFEFEPIADSAGRKLYFSIEGAGVPHENTVKTLIMFHSGYKLGEAYLSEEPINGHIAFRAYSQGRVADLLATIMENLTRDKPGILASPVFYVALALIYIVLSVLLLIAARKAIRSGFHSSS
jgi:hypothetical protein